MNESMNLWIARKWNILLSLLRRCRTLKQIERGNHTFHLDGRQGHKANKPRWDTCDWQTDRLMTGWLANPFGKALPGLKVRFVKVVKGTGNNLVHVWNCICRRGNACRWRMVGIRQNLSCTSPMGIPYFSAACGYDPVCFHCGTSQELVTDNGYYPIILFVMRPGGESVPTKVVPPPTWHFKRHFTGVLSV